MHTDIHTYIHVYTYTHTWMHACIYTYMHAYIYTNVYMHTYAYKHTCIHTYVFTGGVCLSSHGFLPGSFDPGVLSGRFCPLWFLSVPPSVRIHPLKQKVKHHLQISGFIC